MKIVVFILLSFLCFSINKEKDTLTVKPKFVFSSQSSKNFQEPKFLEIEIENKTKNDCYFVKPSFKVLVNDTEETPLLFLAGKLELRKDIIEYSSPYQEEVLALRKKVRENFKKNNSNPNIDLSFDISEESDELVAQNHQVNLYYFLKKGEKVTFTFFVSAKSNPGNYKLFISPIQYPDKSDQYYPDCFKGYKFFKGDFKLDYPFEFRVE